MRKDLPEDDLFALNAYLDGELSPDEQAILERRLEADGDLRAELESLRETMGLLRMLDPVPVPRNFTLDPARYGQAARRGFADWGLGRFPLAAAGALAAALVVFGGLTLVLNRGASGAPAGVAMQAPAAMEAAADNAAEAETFAMEAGATAVKEPAAQEPAAEEPMPAAPAAEAGAAALAPMPTQLAPEAAAAPLLAEAPTEESARIAPDETVPTMQATLTSMPDSARGPEPVAIHSRLAFVIGTVALALLLLGGITIILTRRRR